MNVLLNGEMLPQTDAVALHNRGFRYGDGCFETLLVRSGQSALLAQHEARLRKSLAVLDMNWPQQLHLEAQLQQLCGEKPDWQRVRLWVWRAGAGLYRPESREAFFMLAAEPAHKPCIQLRQVVTFSEEVVLSPSPWSFIKSISAMPYVMAGMEKQQKAADELLLLNHRGEVAEASASNLFFKKRNRWYTPALTTACVAGVMRAWLMKQLLQRGKPVFEVHALADELQKADKLVCTNISGLQPIAQLQDRQYDTDVTELWSLMPPAYRT